MLVLSVIALVITLVGISRVIGQNKTQDENAERQATANSSSPEQRIAQDIALIRDGERRRVEPLKLGRLWCHLAWDYYQDEMDLAKSEAAYIHALRLMEPVPEAQKDYRIVLDNLGAVYLVWGRFDESERCRKRALAVREATADKLEIAEGKSLLAEVHLGQHKYKEAHREALESYTEMIALKDSNTSAVLPTLVTLIYAECSCGECTAALEHAREALSLARSKFAADSPEVAQAHMALGFAEWKTGMKDGPDEEMRAGIEIAKARPPSTNPYALLVSALEQYRSYLVSVHRKREASEIAKKLAQVEGSLQPKVCSSCTVSVSGLQEK
jgi:tetratricopeptide (TPR) repeat protein